MKELLKKFYSNNLLWVIYMLLFGAAMFLMIGSDIMTTETFSPDQSASISHCNYPFLRFGMVSVAIVHFFGGTVLFGRFVASLIEEDCE